MLTGFVLTSLAILLLVLLLLLRPLAKGTRSPLLPGMMAVVLGAIVASVYMIVGTPAALNPQLALPAQNMQDAVAQLKARVAAKPDDVQAWLLLAQAQLTQGEPNQVKTSLRNAVKADPDNADVLSQAAEILSLTRDDRHIPDAAVQWLEHAVKVNGSHQRARWFLGIAQRQRGQDRIAAQTWEPLLPLVDRAAGEALLREVNDARVTSGQQPLNESVLKAIPAEAIAVRVEMNPQLLQSLPEQALVFVTATEAGQGMPLAVKRYAPSEVPSVVYLSDADSAMPTAKLSTAKDVQISVKVSMSGSATPAPDDIKSEMVKPDAKRSVQIRLDGSQP